MRRDKSVETLRMTGGTFLAIWCVVWPCVFPPAERQSSSIIAGLVHLCDADRYFAVARVHCQSRVESRLFFPEQNGCFGTTHDKHAPSKVMGEKLTGSHHLSPSSLAVLRSNAQILEVMAAQLEMLAQRTFERDEAQRLRRLASLTRLLAGEYGDGIKAAEASTAA